MTKSTLDYLPSELPTAFPALVTDSTSLMDAVYIWCVDEKAQTRLRNLPLRERWYCGGYGKDDERFYIRFIQVKVEQKR